MLIRYVRVLNDGPIEDLALKPTYRDQVQPLVIVGPNGSGKTTVLSILVDALTEMAALGHSDVTQSGAGMTRYWFRIGGGRVVRHGAKWSLAIVEFEDGDSSFIYRSQAGTMKVDELPGDFPASVQSAIPAADSDEASRSAGIDDVTSRKVFGQGAYLFFPSTRGEIPHWYNSKSLPAVPLAVTPRTTGQLDKPIVIERGLDALIEWIPQILLESRIPVVRQGDPSESRFAPGGLVDSNAFATLERMNRILQIITGNEHSQFVWGSRQAGLGITTGPTSFVQLGALSAAQSTLLSIFGNVARHLSEAAHRGATQEQGIVVVDEIDSHAHISLAESAIPELMSLFPNIQFIVTAHSPFFVLGMRRQFGPNVSLVQMPEGLNIEAEAYGELGEALQHLRETDRFSEEIRAHLARTNRPLILCEGATDVRYIQAAAKALNRESVLANIDIESIGMSVPGGSRGSGKDALARTRDIIRLNPGISARSILLLFDEDAKADDVSEPNLWVRSVPRGGFNDVITDGIESLLPQECFTEDIFDTKEHRSGNGAVTTVVSPRKTELCDRVCARPTAETFAGFGGVLDTIGEWKDALIGSSSKLKTAVEDGASATPADSTAT